MRAPIVSFPGRLGDSIFAVPTMKAIRTLYESPLCFITTPFCGPAVTLMQKIPGLIETVGICTSYKPTGTEPGLQPWTVPVPPRLMEDGHRDIFHLGMRRHPYPHESITESIGAHYGIKIKSGPWLPEIKPTKGGHVVMHAPVGEAWPNAVLRELLSQQKGKQVLLIGQPREYATYEQMRLNEQEGVRIRDVSSMLDVWEALDGASSFVGVASAPGVVAAGAGLPCRWAIQPGGDERCIPRGCDVVIARVQV